MVTEDSLKDYFRNARLWDVDRLDAAVRSRRFAWIVASVAAGLAIAASLAIAALVPLKTVEPYVIRVDNTTGAVDIVSALKNQSESQDEAITKFFLARYVQTREGFVAADAETSFHIVSIMSSIDEQQRWAAFFSGRNPQSPQVVYGQRIVGITHIKQISLLSSSQALVRFYTELRDSMAGVRRIDAAATVDFTYLKRPAKEEDRWISPLGFEVTAYRSDPEVVQ